MWRRAWLLTSSFTFYVTFVQYALLRRAQLALGLAESDLAPGFALLALLGVAGSLLAGNWIDRRRPAAATLTSAAGALAGALALCAAWGLLAGSRTAIIVCFAPLGLSLGLLIVILLHLFTTGISEDRLGPAAGVAAGASYLVSSLFAGWGGSPEAIGWLDVALIASNVGVAAWARRLGMTSPPTPLRTGEGSVGAGERRHAAPLSTGVASGPSTSLGAGLGEGSLPRMLLRLLPLAAVVLIDTALFVLISRAPGSRLILAGPADWTVFGLAHVASALTAGFLRRRVGWRGLTWAGLGCLLALGAAYVAHRYGLANLSGLIVLAYGAVVGLYTVALFTVFADEAPRERLGGGIAWGMTLVGWICSPAGIVVGTALL